MKEIIDFLMRFVAKPGIPSGGFWSWESIIRAESVHFLSSSFVGFLVFSTLTIFLSQHSRWCARYIFQFSLATAIFCSIFTHILIDGLTTWA